MAIDDRNREEEETLPGWQTARANLGRTFSDVDVAGYAGKAASAVAAPVTMPARTGAAAAPYIGEAMNTAIPGNRYYQDPNAATNLRFQIQRAVDPNRNPIAEIPDTVPSHIPYYEQLPLAISHDPKRAFDPSLWKSIVSQKIAAARTAAAGQVQGAPTGTPPQAGTPATTPTAAGTTTATAAASPSGVAWNPGAQPKIIDMSHLPGIAPAPVAAPAEESALPQRAGFIAAPGVGIFDVPKGTLTPEENAAAIASNARGATDIRDRQRSDDMYQNYQNYLSTLGNRINMMEQDYNRMSQRPEIYKAELAALGPQLDAARKEQGVAMEKGVLPFVEKQTEHEERTRTQDLAERALPSQIEERESTAEWRRSDSAKAQAEAGKIERETQALPRTLEENMELSQAKTQKTKGQGQDTEKGKATRRLFDQVLKISNDQSLSDDERKRQVATMLRSFHATFGFLPENMVGGK